MGKRDGKGTSALHPLDKTFVGVVRLSIGEKRGGGSFMALAVV